MCRHGSRRSARPRPRGGKFWDGRLDLDALAWDVSEHLADYGAALERVARATTQATSYWERLFGDDELLHSLPGIAPATGPTIRAFFGDGSTFGSAKEAACYTALVPSNWSCGTVVQPSRAITKQGPAGLRLACYQAANTARTIDPQLAALYHRLMLEHGHCHTQANVAVARKLVERVWTVLTRGQNYQLRDPDAQPITARAAKAMIADRFTVPPDVGKRAKAHSAATHRARLTR